MNFRYIALAGLAPILFTSPAGAEEPDQTARLTEESRAIAGQMIQTLGGELKKSIKEIGPAGAITVCKEKAPAIAAAISAEKNVSLRRVTFKNRNPNSVPDAWEAKVLQEFEQRLAKGVMAAGLEYGEVVKEGDKSTFRYMKGLVLQEVCMTCHGTKETIPDAVKAKLSQEYPNDQATGYLPNMLRGAISLKKPL